MIKKLGNPKVKSILTLLTGTTIAQAIPIAISPILTRIYTPEDFGIFALFLSITSMLSVAITARYELAIMLPKEDKEAVNLVGLSMIITTIISGFTLLVILFGGKGIATLLGNDDIYPWLYFVPVSLFLTGIYQAYNYWSNRKLQYGRLATNRVAQSTTTAGMNLGLGPLKEGPFGLITGNVVAQLIATLRLGMKSIKDDNFSFSDITVKDMKELAKRYDQFPKVSIWSALLNSGSSNMPVFLFSTFFNSTIVGWYSMAHRVLKVPMSLLGSAVAQVFFQTSSNLKNEDPSKLKEVTFRSYKIMLLIGLIPISIIFGFGDYIFSFVFGEAWGTAGNFARILSIWLLLVFVSSPLSMLFTVMEKEGALLKFNIAIFCTRALSLVIGGVIYKDVFVAVFLFSITGIIFWLWHCLYILKIVQVPYVKSISYTGLVITSGLAVSLLLRYVFVQNLW